MSAQTHLAQYGVTTQDAYNFIINNLTNPLTIFDTCKSFGVTNDMLSEIVGVDVSLVRGFWQEHLLSSTDLEPITTSIQHYNLTVSSPSVVEGNDSVNVISGSNVFTGGNVFTGTTVFTGNSVFTGTTTFVGSTPTTATVSLQLDTAAVSDVTVNYQISNSSTATMNQDFTGLSTGSIIFHTGESTKNLDFNIIKDNVFETHETIKIDFSGNQINNTNSTITIVNDDTAPIVQQSYGIGGAGTTDASTGNYAFIITPGNYTHTISNLDSGDTLKYDSSITSSSTSIVNSSGTIYYSDGSHHTTIQLNGIIHYDNGLS